MTKDNIMVNFGLRKIATEQFAIIESNFDESSQSKINISTGLRFGVNTEKHMVSVTLAVNLSQEDRPFIILEISCFFEIQSDDWENLYNIELGKVELEIGFARHVVMLTIGTIRGVLHSKTENTVFNKFFIPTVDVDNLVKGNVVIKLDSLT
ncbi:hypothetical protein ACS6L2_13190 [Aquirufa ecclesiirivi]